MQVLFTFAGCLQEIRAGASTHCIDSFESNLILKIILNYYFVTKNIDCLIFLEEGREKMTVRFLIA